jgi:hypothetical protein
MYKLKSIKDWLQMMSYLEEIKKRDVFHNGTVQALIMLKEKEVGESSIDELWVFSTEFHQLESLFAAVSPPPDSCRVLTFPRRPRVGLHRHHIQTHARRQKARQVFFPKHQITKADGKELIKVSKTKALSQP